MTDMITITFADATTLALEVFDKSASVEWMFEGLSIERQPNKVGITTDPNYNYRVVECTAKLTAAQIVDTLDVKLLPAAVPTYDATDPKIIIYLSGAKSITMLCAITKAKAKHIVDDQWAVSFQFVGRTL